MIGLAKAPLARCAPCRSSALKPATIITRRMATGVALGSVWARGRQRCRASVLALCCAAIPAAALVTATAATAGPRGTTSSAHAPEPTPSPVRVDVQCTAQEAGAGQEAPGATAWAQRTITLPQHKRGCHIITNRIYDAIPEIAEYEVGLANVFILHTSASLTINENASPDVLLDLNDSLDRIAPEGRHYRHDDEGPDDMPAHVKSSLMGASLTIPISKGRLALGTWQGIYLNEHRDRGGSRSIVVTLQGQKRADGRAYGRYR